MITATHTSVPAGSRRFWVTVFCFAIANLGAWVGYDRLVEHRRHALLEVRQSAPSDQSLVSGRPVFWWTFNLDVAPPAPNDPPPGEVSPQVGGKWKWEDPRTLTFKPDAPLPKATPLTVSLLPARLRSLDGFRLGKPFVTAVHTAPLEVRGVRQTAFDDRDQLVLEIEFNDDVLPAEALQHLTLHSYEGKPVAFHSHGEATGHFIRIITDPVPSATTGHTRPFVRVSLSQGFSGRSGPLGLEQPYECEVPVGSALIATAAHAYFVDHDQAVLSISFNNPIDADALKPLFSVEPAVPFTVSSGYEGVELRGAFQPATRYAIRIAKAPAGVPNKSCPRADTLSAYVPDHAPSLWFEHEEGYLGSAGNRSLLAHAINVSNARVTLTRIYDNNLVNWRNIRAGADSYDRSISSRDIKLPALKNKTQDVQLSLDDLLPADAPRDGVYLVGLESTATVTTGNDDESDYRGYGRRQASSLVTLSDIGLTAKQGRTAVTVWATSLRTAEPLANVRIRLYSDKNQFLGQTTTGENGLAAISPGALAKGESASVIVADRPAADSSAIPFRGQPSFARDLTWLDLRTGRVNFGDSDTSGAAYLRAGHEAFIYTDRGVYRPGETVHLRAIVRGPDGITPPSFPVKWQFRRPDLHDWKSFLGKIDADGAVSLDLPLPDDLPTGRWSVRLGLPGVSNEAEAFGDGDFQVEDFMPNRMQVGLKLDGAEAGDRNASPRFLVKDEPVAAEVQADYLFGKPVTERPARIVARLDPATFSPAQWNGWTFGDSAGTAEILDELKLTGHRIELPEQSLDDHGHASFDLDLQTLLAGEAPPSGGPVQHHAKQKRHAAAANQSPTTAPSAKYTGPWRLTVTASVIETGGRAVSASRQADLDPIGRYIGIRPISGAGSSDTPSRFEIALVSPAGQASPDDANLDAMLYRENWNNSLAYESGHYVYHSTRLLEPTREKIAVHVSGGKATLDVQPSGMGAYVLRVRDPQTGGMASILFYSGRGVWEDNISRENPEKLELIVRPMPQADALLRSIRNLDATGTMTALKALAAGEGNSASRKLHLGGAAQVIVRSPFAGRLLLNVETDDVVSSRVIDMTGSSFAVPIALSQNCRPNAYVTATVIRAVDPDAAWQTHRATGSLRVPLDNTDRKLEVKLDAPAQIRPTQSMSVALRVTDSAGEPVRDAAVTVAAVDEGICQLTGFTTPDPFQFFTRERALGVGTADLFGQLMPEVARPEGISAVGGDKDAYNPRHGSPVSARRVKPVSLVSQVIHTDADGLAQADFNTPQFTGKLRLMAVASGGPAFGSGEGAVLVRSPLLVQSSWPRFTAPGDKFQVPLLVFNNSPAEGEVIVTMHIADGPLRVGSATDAALSMKLTANGQATRAIEITATNDVGVSHASLIAKMGNETYEEDIELPVRPACPEISLGGYAVATPDAPAELSLPVNMLKSTEHFQLKVTQWPLLQLPQGLDYLERYPYGCLEQTTSTLFPLVYLSDIGQQIAPGVFEKQRVADKVQAGITRLIGMQTTNGGLAMWPAYREPWPWGSVYAAHFLIEAESAGHPVPEEFKKSLLGYVRNLLNASSDDPSILETQAYACYVLAMAGKPERAVMSRLTEIVNAPRTDGVVLPGQSRLHLATAWLAAGRRDLAEGLLPQTLPLPRATRSLSGSLGSPVRDRAILIDTLLAIEPDHPALPELVQQLVDSGRHGQWRSTQDTAFAVLALGRYLRQSKSAVPYTAAELFLNDNHLAGIADGKPLLWEAGESHSAVPEDGSKLHVQVTGPAGAKAHLSWIATGVPLTAPPAADHGMSIRRRLLDERGNALKVNRVHSGDLVQVELTIASATPLEYVAIDDLLPAGLEIENPRLKTTATDVVQEAQDAPTTNHFSDSRLDMRDDRLVLIGNLFSAGSGTYVYTARAVTPGKFVLPPAHAECMYDTATNSLSEGGTFEVLPAGSPRIADVKD
jgi:uncharacterized protein YfaS (alpha-2-macroglobulin family)